MTRSIAVSIIALACLAWPASLSAQVVLRRAYTNAARYAPGEAATINIELDNSTGQLWQDSLSVRIWHLGSLAFAGQIDVTLQAGGSHVESLNWTPPRLDFRGYLVAVESSGGELVTTAIDVSSDWTRFPRYGYMTEFFAGQTTSQSEAYIRQLQEDYHINALQFYDWMWRHENVIREVRPGVIADEWVDWRNETISKGVLEDLIGTSHARNVAAMPYFMIYAARENYDVFSGVSPEWGLYADTGHTDQYTHALGSTGNLLYIFDPSNPQWQSHQLGEVERALSVLPFDGIHFDMLGDQGPMYDYAGGTVDMPGGAPFRSMLDATAATFPTLESQLSPTFGKFSLVLNHVGAEIAGWGAPEVVTSADTDFLYAEVWEPETYQEVHDYVRWARGQSGNKALVLAAYMNYYDSQLTEFSEPAVRLADASFAVSGAHHLEMGNGDVMLASEFFPATPRVASAALLAATKDIYTHLSAQENVLFDRRLQWGDDGPQFADIVGAARAVDPLGQSIWLEKRRFDAYDVLHLVNLVGNDALWRNPADPPTPQQNLQVRYRPGQGVMIESALLASPDQHHGRPTALPVTTGTDSVGPYVEFTVPQLEYWASVILRRWTDSQAGARLEAEDAVKTGVSLNSDHAGYSGSGFVDQFDGNSDGVSFAVCVPVDGTYQLMLGYANATGNTATRDIRIDGEMAGSVSMPPLPDWDTWSQASISVNLTAGMHDLVVGFGGFAFINLDYVELLGTATGLRGQYFDTDAFAEPVAVMLDGTIDFAWGAGSPVAGAAPDGLAIRWNGTITPPRTDTFTFYTSSDQPTRLFVDNKLVIDNWTDHALIDDSGTIDLIANVPVDAVLVYRETGGDATISLSWSSSVAPREVVATSYLHPTGCHFDEQAPTVPANLSETGSTTTSVSLQWDASIDDIALGTYDVLRDGVPVGVTSATSFVDDTVSAGNTYSYAVCATDVLGNQSGSSAPLLVSVASPIMGDYTGDGTLSADDLAVMTDCLAGPGLTPAPTSPVLPAACLSTFDFDQDNDIDAEDVAAFLDAA